MLRIVKVSVALGVILILTACQRSLTTSDLQGNTVKLSHFDGQYRVLHYWASWCRSCVNEITELNQFQQRYGQQGIKVLGVNYDLLPQDKLKQLVAKLDVQFVTLAEDPAELLGIPAVPGLPMTFILDRNGRIIKRLDGPQTVTSLAHAVGLTA